MFSKAAEKTSSRGCGGFSAEQPSATGKQSPASAEVELILLWARRMDYVIIQTLSSPVWLSDTTRQILGEYMFPLSVFFPSHAPRLFHFTDLLIFFYPWPFLFLLKILCLDGLDCCPLPPRQKFAFFNTVQVSIAVQDPTISHSNSCPGCKQSKSWQKLTMDPVPLPVFSSHMDTHTELLLTWGERRSNHQLLAKLL